jgi:hypothetical protein
VFQKMSFGISDVEAEAAQEWLKQNAPADLRRPLKEPRRPPIIGRVEEEDVDALAAREDEWRRTWRQGRPTPSAETRLPTPEPKRGPARAFSRQELEAIHGPGYDPDNPDDDQRLDPVLDDDDDFDAADLVCDDVRLPRFSLADDELDDRPQWERGLDLEEDWFEQQEADRSSVRLRTAKPEPVVVILCADGCGKPVKPRGTLCSACYEYKRTHGGKKRPLRLTVGRRAR